MRTRRNPKLHHFARELRKDMTDAEHRLWRRLRGGQLHGIKFRRQYVIGSYSHPPKASYCVAPLRRTNAYCLQRRALSETFGGWLYIADFAAPEIRLIIELDGGQHADQQAYDQQRDLFLQHQGYRVLRFWNHDVLQQTESVMTEILKHCQLPR